MEEDNNVKNNLEEGKEYTSGIRAATTMDAPIVEIYSTPTCHYCHLAKDWLKEMRVKYVDYDVTVDTTRAKEVIEMTGQRGVPVIKIGNDVIIGFNQVKMEELLGVK